MAAVFSDVRFQGQSGKHLLAASISGFDPIRTSHPNFQHCHRPLFRLRAVV
jgi:hypothetical protein